MTVVRDSTAPKALNSAIKMSVKGVTNVLKVFTRKLELGLINFLNLVIYLIKDL